MITGEDDHECLGLGISSSVRTIVLSMDTTNLFQAAIGSTELTVPQLVVLFDQSIELTTGRG